MTRGRHALWALARLSLLLFVATSVGCLRGAQPRPATSSAIDLFDEACLADCIDDGECRLDVEHDRCVAVSDRRCRESKGCRVRGRCSLDERENICVPTAGWHCRQSVGCVDDGDCVIDVPNRSCESTTQPQNEAAGFTGVGIMGGGFLQVVVTIFLGLYGVPGDGTSSAVFLIGGAVAIPVGAIPTGYGFWPIAREPKLGEDDAGEASFVVSPGGVGLRF